MKTHADFLRAIAARSPSPAITEFEAARLREIAQQIEDEREIIEAVAELNARVGAIAARRPSAAPSSSPPTEFTLPPVDPLEAITPTYQPDVPPSPPAQERL